MSPDEILANLTAPQREAVTHRDGPMLVVAGAGSGKTRVVTRRIAWLISQGVWPSQILAMTFTNKAAREMKERIAAMTGSTPYNIGTFHGCCARFLRHDIELLPCGRDKNFTIYDDSEQKTLLKHCISQASDRVPKNITPSFMSTVISNLKNNRCSLLDALPAPHFANFLSPIEEICGAYEDSLCKCNAFDFDDLLLMTYRILTEVPGMTDIYHNRFRYLLVDEYQDTNRLQYDLIMKLTNDAHNVHVTGDPDQSIYSWRGADYHNILSFQQDFPEARIVMLEQNYRSTPTILNAANAVIEQNTNRFPKNLFTQNNDGLKITLTATESDRKEAEWIYRKIMRLRDNGHSWKNFAVFYRTNAQSRAIEEQFIRAGVPYQLLGGQRFYDRKEIKDFIALLRLKVNPSDQAAVKRIFESFHQTAGIGPKTRNELENAANNAGMPILNYLTSEDFRMTLTGRSAKAQRLKKLSDWLGLLRSAAISPVSKAVQEIDSLLGFSEQLGAQYGTDNIENRRENFQSFLGRAATFTHDFPDADLAVFLQDVALVADVDGHDGESDCVVMMTLHSSKGLEFPYVFISGVEEGLLPHGHSLGTNDFGQEDQEQIEEERRLFYVGITRAQKALYLSTAQTRFIHNRSSWSQPSRFIHEIPSELLKAIRYHQGRELPSLL